jgi:FtsH-binding integral membrane protein
MRVFLGLILLVISIGGCNVVTQHREQLNNVTGTVMLAVVCFIIGLYLLSRN